MAVQIMTKTDLIHFNLKLKTLIANFKFLLEQTEAIYTDKYTCLMKASIFQLYYCAKFYLKTK